MGNGEAAMRMGKKWDRMEKRETQNVKVKELAIQEKKETS